MSTHYLWRIPELSSLSFQDVNSLYNLTRQYHSQAKLLYSSILLLINTLSFILLFQNHGCHQTQQQIKQKSLHPITQSKNPTMFFVKLILNILPRKKPFISFCTQIQWKGMGREDHYQLHIIGVGLGGGDQNRVMNEGLISTHVALT